MPGSSFQTSSQTDASNCLVTRSPFRAVRLQSPRAEPACLSGRRLGVLDRTARTHAAFLAGGQATWLCRTRCVLIWVEMPSAAFIERTFRWSHQRPCSPPEVSAVRNLCLDLDRLFVMLTLAGCWGFGHQLKAGQGEQTCRRV